MTKVTTRSAKEGEKHILKEMYPFNAEKKIKLVPKSRKSQARRRVCENKPLEDTNLLGIVNELIIKNPVKIKLNCVYLCKRQIKITYVGRNKPLKAGKKPLERKICKETL